MTGLMRLIIAVFFMSVSVTNAQTGKPTIIRTDSTTQRKNPAFTKDTGINIVNGDTIKSAPVHNPRTATMRSLILPGWGQAYNREYWKIPLVYAAIGTTAGFWIYNNIWYKRARDAYDIRVNHPEDSLLIYPDLQPLSNSSLEFYRNEYRRDRDYAILYFCIAWALNIVDATVFGHLRQFDVSEDLSLKINPVLKQHNTGLSIVLGYKQPVRKVYLIP
jgi:hypothetical protein